MLRCAVIFAVVLAHLTSARVAAADSKVAADALFRDAVTLAENGEFERAIRKFRTSYQLDPARGTLLGWAMAEERAGRLAQSLTRFQKLRDFALKANDQKRLQVAKERIADLEPRVPKLLIVGDEVPDGTILHLDGQALPAEAMDSALPVDPGQHTLKASAPGGWTFEKRVNAGESETVRIELSWTKPTPAPGPNRARNAKNAKAETADIESDGFSSMQTVGLLVGGAGLVAAGVGTYLYVDAGSDFDALDTDCPNRNCPAGAQDRIDSGRSKETWGQVGWIAGGVLLATGASLFVFGKPEQASARVSVLPGGVAVHGSF